MLLLDPNPLFFFRTFLFPPFFSSCSEEQLSDEDIDREFYGENNEFGRDSNPFPENIKKKEIQSK